MNTLDFSNLPPVFKRELLCEIADRVANEIRNVESILSIIPHKEGEMSQFENDKINLVKFHGKVVDMI